MAFIFCRWALADILSIQLPITVSLMCHIDCNICTHLWCSSAYVIVEQCRYCEAMDQWGPRGTPVKGTSGPVSCLGSPASGSPTASLCCLQMCFILNQASGLHHCDSFSNIQSIGFVSMVVLECKQAGSNHGWQVDLKLHVIIGTWRSA